MNNEGLPDTPSEQVRYDVMVRQFQQLNKEHRLLKLLVLKVYAEVHKLSMICGVQPPVFEAESDDAQLSP